MTARALLFVPVLLLTACAAHRPYDEFGICLTDTEDLTALKSVVTQVAARYGSTTDDYSKSASRDLEALDSPIAKEHLFALVVEDTRWRSESGPVMINNIGAASAKSVGVSMFRNNDLLGSDSDTGNLRRDLFSAASSRWKIVDAPSPDGTYHECVE
ncbi:hypothetical protein [Qipengyuania sp. NPDC077563]|uniref:hypothetical protein n=1 Tax=Qipengyuania sp. NPDC077563 TaxID=3364497 RepID=UPI0038504F56